MTVTSTWHLPVHAPGKPLRGLNLQLLWPSLALIRDALSSWQGRAALGLSALFLWLHLYSLHAASSYGLYILRLDNDRGISEFLEASMLVFAGVAYAVRGARKGQAVFLALAAILLYLAIDGALLLHEGIASVVAPGSQHTAEFLYMAGLGGLFTAMLGVAMWRGSATQRTELLAVLLVLGVFGVFAAGVDAANELATRVNPVFYEPFVFMEDGGELLGITALFALAVANLRRARTAPGEAAGLPRISRGASAGGLAGGC